MKQTDTATIRDIYEVGNRIEDKLDARINGLEKSIDENANEISKMKGQATIISLVFSGALTIVGWVIGPILKKL